MKNPWINAHADFGNPTRTPPVTAYAPARNQPLPESAYAEAGNAVLLTIRADRDRPFEGNAPLCRRITELLEEMPEEYDCWVGAYCLMPDHFHFVAGTNRDGSSVLTFRRALQGQDDS